MVKQNRRKHPVHQQQEGLKPEKKQKIGKKKKWIIAFLAFTLVQFGGLFALDQFLKQPNLPVGATVPVTKPPITPPSEAVMYAISEDQSDIAYTTKDGELVIADADKNELYREKAGNITYLHWLSKSNALLYMVGKTYSQELYLLQTNGLQASATTSGTTKKSNHVPKLLKNWNGTKRTIEKVYFSPYVEFFNLHVKNGTKDEIYKYKAGTGLFQISFSLKVQSITYDDRKDILTVTIPSGQQYRLTESDRFVPLSGPNLNVDTQTTNPTQNQNQTQNQTQNQNHNQTPNQHVKTEPIDPQQPNNPLNLK